jgi:hypothetical protein
MKLRSAGVALIALLFAAPAFARTSIYVNFGAPPPPVVVFRHEPRWELIPGSDVYEIVDYDQPGYDEFLCDGWYYIYNDGYWYRSDSWRGPFYAIYEDYVPAPIWYVPTTYWRVYPRHVSYERDRWARMGWRGGSWREWRGGTAWRGGSAYRGGTTWRGGDAYRGGTTWRGGTSYRGGDRWPAGRTQPGIEYRGGQSRWNGGRSDVRWQGGDRAPVAPRDNGGTWRGRDDGGAWRGRDGGGAWRDRNGGGARVQNDNGWPGRGNGGWHGRGDNGGDRGNGRWRGRGDDGGDHGNGRGHGDDGGDRGHGGGGGHGHGHGHGGD